MNACPSCEQAVSVPTDAIEGEIIACAACEAELEVLEVEPLELALAPEVAEDWGE